MQKYRGVAKQGGGYRVTLSSKYLGYTKDFDRAVHLRVCAEIKKFGRTLEKYEPFAIGNLGLVPLYGRNAKLLGWSKIDKADLDKVRGVAWTISATGYAVGRPPKSKNATKMHRYILGCDTSTAIDHINRDKLDNRKENLRECEQCDNSKNTLMGKNNTSGFKGVSKYNKKWRARIMVDRKEIRLGIFNSAYDAALAYDEAAIKYHGEWAATNKDLGVL